MNIQGVAYGHSKKIMLNDEENALLDVLKCVFEFCQNFTSKRCFSAQIVQIQSKVVEISKKTKKAALRDQQMQDQEDGQYIHHQEDFEHDHLSPGILEKLKFWTNLGFGISFHRINLQFGIRFSRNYR